MQSILMAIGALFVFFIGYLFGYVGGRSSGKVEALEQAYGVEDAEEVADGE